MGLHSTGLLLLRHAASCLLTHLFWLSSENTSHHPAARAFRLQNPRNKTTEIRTPKKHRDRQPHIRSAESNDIGSATPKEFFFPLGNYQQRLSDLIGPYWGTYRIAYRVLQPLLVWIHIPCETLCWHQEGPTTFLIYLHP